MNNIIRIFEKIEQYWVNNILQTVTSVTFFFSQWENWRLIILLLGMVFGFYTLLSTFLTKKKIITALFIVTSMFYYTPMFLFQIIDAGWISSLQEYTRYSLFMGIFTMIFLYGVIKEKNNKWQKLFFMVLGWLLIRSAFSIHILLLNELPETSITFNNSREFLQEFHNQMLKKWKYDDLFSDGQSVFDNAPYETFEQALYSYAAVAKTFLVVLSIILESIRSIIIQTLKTVGYFMISVVLPIFLKLNLPQIWDTLATIKKIMKKYIIKPNFGTPKDLQVWLSTIYKKSTKISYRLSKKFIEQLRKEMLHEKIKKH